MRAELAARVNDRTVDDSEDRLDAFDLLFRDGEVVRREHREVGQLADGDGTLVLVLAGEPGARNLAIDWS